MRSTSLGLAVFALCTVMSVVLWLGGNDSGSGRLSVVTTSAAPVAEEQRFDADEVSRSDHHHWQWTGGGVRGLSEGGENIALDNVSATLRAAFIDLFNVPMFHFDLRHVSRTAPHIITRFRRLFMSFAVNSNDDCLIRMDPFKQLQCHLWANKLNSAVGAERSTIFSGVPLSSLCSLYLSCSLWKRGRHGIQLTPALLQGVFRTLQQDDELRNSSQLMLRNVIHGGSNWHEYRWLPNRLKVCEDLITTKEHAPMDVRAIFQGGDITISELAGPDGRPVKRLATRDNGSPRTELTRTLTSLEAMSVLYLRATNGGRPQPIVYSATSTLAECRTTAINVLLLSGDSMARQLFWRIVKLLRHGPQGQVRVPYGSRWVNTSFRHYPNQRHSKWQDVVFAIFPEHDELHVFESLMPHDTVFHSVPYKRNNTNTVHRFFSDIVEQRRHFECGGGGVKDNNNNNSPRSSVPPLFYIVYLFDAVTARPRTDALAPCLPAIPVSEFPLPSVHYFYEGLQRALAQGMTLIHDPPIPSFRALGIRIPLHVHNANAWDRHESPTTYKWLERMATQCSVTAASDSTILAKPPTPAAIGLEENSPPEWIVGEHPTSDITHLYRVETQLRHTESSVNRMRVAPPGRKEIVANDSYVFQPSDYRLTRLETPFVWLRNTTTAAKRGVLVEQHQEEAENSHRPGVFFSKLRLLDAGKIMLSSKNVIHTPDMLHEDCDGIFWLAGAAMYKQDSQSQLRHLSRRIASIAIGLMQQRTKLPGYHSKFSFHPGSDCGAMGTLMAVNAMLIDMVVDEKRDGGQ